MHLETRSVIGLGVALAGAACAHRGAAPNVQAVAYQAEGARALAAGELDRAAGLFSLALEFQPNLAEADNGLGLVALRRGDSASAEAHFEAALAARGDLAEAHVNLGVVAWQRGDATRALERYRSALAIDPGFPVARLGAAQALVALDRLDEARWELAKLCEVSPRDAAARAAYAAVLLRSGHLALAESAAQSALALEAEQPAALGVRGELLLRAGDPAGALALLRRAATARPTEPGPRLLLVTALVAAGFLDEAEREADGLALAAPRSAEAAFAEAFVALRRGDAAAARQAATRALALRPRFPQARLVLAEALYRDGHTGEGRAELQRFVDEADGSLAAEREAALRHLRISP